MVAYIEIEKLESLNHFTSVFFEIIVKNEILELEFVDLSLSYLTSCYN